MFATGPQSSSYEVYLFRMKHRHGHRVCWMLAGRNIGIMWRHNTQTCGHNTSVSIGSCMRGQIYSGYQGWGGRTRVSRKKMRFRAKKQEPTTRWKKWCLSPKSRPKSRQPTTKQKKNLPFWTQLNKYSSREFGTAFFLFFSEVPGKNDVVLISEGFCHESVRDFFPDGEVISGFGSRRSPHRPGTLTVTLTTADLLGVPACRAWKGYVLYSFFALRALWRNIAIHRGRIRKAIAKLRLPWKNTKAAPGERREDFFLASRARTNFTFIFICYINAVETIESNCSKKHWIY